MSMKDRKDEVKGEGNPEADRRYRQGVRDTVQSGDLEKKIRKTTDVSDEERKKMREAEKEAAEKARR